MWKFSRLRPSNFPTVRLSQLAAMLSVAGGLFSRVLEATDIKQIKELFEVSASDYWDNHFVFGKKSRKYYKEYRIAGNRHSSYKCSYSFDICLWTVAGIVRILCERALSFLEEYHSGGKYYNIRMENGRNYCRISILFPGTDPTQK